MIILLGFSLSNWVATDVAACIDIAALAVMVTLDDLYLNVFLADHVAHSMEECTFSYRVEKRTQGKGRPCQEALKETRPCQV